MGIALSLLVSTGTSTKDLCKVSNQVPPAGKDALDGTAIVCLLDMHFESGLCTKCASEEVLRRRGRVRGVKGAKLTLLCLPSVFPDGFYST